MRSFAALGLVIVDESSFNHKIADMRFATMVLFQSSILVFPCFCTFSLTFFIFIVVHS